MSDDTPRAPRFRQLPPAVREPLAELLGSSEAPLELEALLEDSERLLPRLALALALEPPPRLFAVRRRRGSEPR